MSDSEEEHEPSDYPPPLVVEPTSEHKESWIVLHGRGDKAASFAQGMIGFLRFTLPDGRTLQQHLPYVRFVFPTASYRRARVFNRSTITQWFDIYSWNSNEKMHWQVEGLRETSAWIGQLVNQECAAVGAANVTVGGLSQGCASTMIWNLLWDGEPVRCVFGMSGWLPFRHVVELFIENAKASGDARTEDVFEREGQDDDPYKAAVIALCQELEVRKEVKDNRKSVPIFLGHGVKDQTVYVDHGRKMAQCLKELGYDVSWTEYEGLPHWFHGEELMGVLQFVEKCKHRTDTEVVENLGPSSS